MTDAVAEETPAASETGSPNDAVTAATSANTGADSSTDTTAETPKPDAVPAEAFDASKLVIPSDASLMAVDLEQVVKEATVLKLTMSGAQQLVDHRVAEVKAAIESYAAQTLADPELGGQHHSETTRLAKAGVEWMYPPGTPPSDAVLKWFSESPIGYHPEVLRGFVRLGRALSEDRPIGAAPPSKAAVPAEDKLFPSTAPAPKATG